MYATGVPPGVHQVQGAAGADGSGGRGCYIVGLTLEETSMPKGEQRSNKLAKKPKKDNSPPKESTSDRPMPPMTSVIPKGKLKKAP
jgi:hypothetical protein